MNVRGNAAESLTFRNTHVQSLFQLASLMKALKHTHTVQWYLQQRKNYYYLSSVDVHDNLILEDGYEPSFHGQQMTDQLRKWLYSEPVENDPRKGLIFESLWMLLLYGTKFPNYIMETCHMEKVCGSWQLPVNPTGMGRQWNQSTGIA